MGSQALVVERGCYWITRFSKYQEASKGQRENTKTLVLQVRGYVLIVHLLCMSLGVFRVCIGLCATSVKV